MLIATYTGHLLDLFPRGGEMVLWFLADSGERVRLRDRFVPVVYLEGREEDLKPCARMMVRGGEARALGWRERLDFWTNKPRRVYALEILRIEKWRRALSRYARRFPALHWHNADLQPEQAWCFQHNAFPLMRCRFAADGDRLVHVENLDDRWEPDYAPPDLRTIVLRGEGQLRQRGSRLSSLSIEHEGRTIVFDDPPTLLPQLQQELDRIDPDLVVTHGGDGFLFPLLFTMARQMRFPLRLGRELPPEPRRIETQGRTYMSYGMIMYQAPDYHLFGRLHLDAENSFMVSHTGMDGLYEVARLSALPVQRITRRSIGTGITSVQLAVAWEDGFLIPWKKAQPEALKTAAQLLKTDRGGFVYAPEIGFHEHVLELDFASMFPSIMVNYNVSPETINCPCCKNKKVPEIDYTICEQRHGLVSRALAPIIEKRKRLKALRKQAGLAGDMALYQRYDARQEALKWMLVCCFGYLGYRNARFGRIEAHESVCAFARELLTVAKEASEERGWQLLAANVDCLFLRREGPWGHDDVKALCAEIDKRTNLTIAVEGVYKWVAFLPSRQISNRPVPTRYFGIFEDGSMKFRGIECRRRDVAPYIRKAQREMLDLLATIPDKAAFETRREEVLAAIQEYEDRIRERDVPLEELAIKTVLSRDPENYRGNHPSALAARQAAKAGLNLHGGQKISYLIIDQKNRDAERRVCLLGLASPETTYDVAAYVGLFRRAMNTLLWPLGVELAEKEPRDRGEKREEKGEQLDLLGEIPISPRGKA